MRPLVGSTWTNFSYRVTNQEIEPTNLRILIARVDLPLPMKRHHKTIIKKKPKSQLTCPTQQAHAFTSLQCKGNVVQNGRQIRSIFNFQVLDGDQGIVVGTGRPVRRDTVGFYDGRRLLRKLEAVHLINRYLQIVFEKGRLTIQLHVRRSCITSESVL